MKLSSSFLFFATLLSPGIRPVASDDSTWDVCYVCLLGGCDQTKCGAGAVCLGGGCNQDGLFAPICTVGRCSQVEATDPVCPGGFCNQFKSTRAQCPGGTCCREEAEFGGVCFNCPKSDCGANDANWESYIEDNPYIPDHVKDITLNHADWQNNPHVIEHCGPNCGEPGAYKDNPYYQEYVTNNKYVQQWTKANNAEFNYTNYVHDTACTDCQESGGCDQTKCAPFPSCDMGNCDQQGTNSPICNGGLCNQLGASTPVCPGGFCCQDAPTLLSCPAGGCETACEALANLTDTVTSSVSDFIEHCTCVAGGCDQTACVGYATCYGGTCDQTGLEAPSCFGGGCVQTGANNPGCLGGNCVQKEATGIFASCIGGGCETDSEIEVTTETEATESSSSKIGTAFAVVVLMVGMASAMI